MNMIDDDDASMSRRKIIQRTLTEKSRTGRKRINFSRVRLWSTFRIRDSLESFQKQFNDHNRSELKMKKCA